MLALSIQEQPARYHRFRYETEIQGGKLGGLLYGRSGSKSCVRLQLTGVEPAKHRCVIVIGGTVNLDGYPHPFYMHGEGCESGAFQWKRDIGPNDGRRFEISLEKVSLVCVSQGGDKLQQAIKRRETINFNPFNKKMSDAKYTSRNLRELRLVFQVFYVDSTGATVPSKTAIVQTDIVSDIKFQAKLEIEDIHPEQGYLFAKEQVIWIYFKDQLPHSDTSQYSAFLDSDGFPIIQCEIRSLKKQLMVLCIPQLTSAVPDHASERIRCSLRVNDLKSDVTAEHDFILWNFCNQCGIQLIPGTEEPEPVSKRRRVANGSGGDVESSPTPAAEEAAAASPAAAAAATESEPEPEPEPEPEAVPKQQKQKQRRQVKKQHQQQQQPVDDMLVAVVRRQGSRNAAASEAVKPEHNAE